jgi:hypothetical protein
MSGSFAARWLENHTRVLDHPRCSAKVCDGGGRAGSGALRVSPIVLSETRGLYSFRMSEGLRPLFRTGQEVPRVPPPRESQNQNNNQSEGGLAAHIKPVLPTPDALTLRACVYSAATARGSSN